MYSNREAELFHHDCKAMLNTPTFDEFLRKEKYKAYKAIENRGENKICFNCMYCDRINQKCINNLVIEKKMESCYKARNMFLLKKAGLYGAKRNTKTGVD